MKQRTRYVVSGVLAGVVNGLFGGGGGPLGAQAEPAVR